MEENLIKVFSETDVYFPSELDFRLLRAGCSRHHTLMLVTSKLAIYLMSVASNLSIHFIINQISTGLHSKNTR